MSILRNNFYSINEQIKKFNLKADKNQFTISATMKNMIKRCFLNFLYSLSALMTIIIIVSLAIFSLLQAEAPLVSTQTSRIEAYLSQKLHHPVQIKTLSLRWQNLMPVLEIKDLAVLASDHKQNIFYVKKLILGIKLMDSLRQRDLVLKYIYINQIALSLIKNAQHHWEIVNLSDILPNNNPLETHDFLKRFHLKGENISLNFIDLFSKPIQIKQIEATISLEKNLKKFSGLKITADDLKASNTDINLAGRAVVSEKNMDLNLRYALASIGISHLDQYLPYFSADFNPKFNSSSNINPPHSQSSHLDYLDHWLINAIKKFETVEGSLILEGNPADFPFQNDSGKFSVEANIKNLRLEYAPQWPQAENLNGKLIFTGSGFNADVFSADILGVNLKNIHIHISDWKKPVFILKGKVFTQTEKLLNFIEQSPLKETIGKYTHTVADNWQGKAMFDLMLSMPFAEANANTQAQNKPAIKLNGQLVFSENSAKVSDTALKNLNGDIDFTEKGITGKHLTAVLKNLPITINILPAQYHIQYDKWQIAVSDADSDSARNTKTNHHYFKIAFSHPQTAAGKLKLTQNPLSGAKLEGKVFYLNILPDQKHPVHEEKIDPKKIPSLNIIIQALNYKNKKFGRIHLESMPDKTGLVLNKITAHLDKTEMHSSGYWKDKFSFIQGKLESKNLQQTFKNWGFPENIESFSANLNYQAQWADALYSPDLNTLNGKFDVSISKGRLLNIGSRTKMNIGKLLTLLSFQSFQRRLNLDFSDLTQQGLNFDRITGSFILNNGIAKTNNTLLEAPLAQVKLSGTIDLVNETYHLNFSITPHLTSSVPIIAALAGGPVVGAAAWAANKLVNPLLNKMTTDIYTVTGSWDNPQINNQNIHTI